MNCSQEEAMRCEEDISNGDDTSAHARVYPATVGVDTVEEVSDGV